jgi:hypothetical protein
MITGASVEDVYDFCGHNGSEISDESDHPEKRKGFGTVEILKYLLEYRYFLGSWAEFENGECLAGIDQVQFFVKIDDVPAALIVPSSRLGGKCTHVIYWDGKKIYDPSPEAKEDPDFEDYKILTYMPVLKFD